MSSQPSMLFTLEEFLDREVESPYRHEYKQGRIEMMAGGTHNHSLIQANASGELRNVLEDRNCRVHGEALMVYIAAANATTYPDAMVICGPPVYADSRRKNIVTNPIVIVEVISRSTEKYDRGDKFLKYQLLPSLQEYVLIAQEEPLVELYRRVDGGDWTKTEYRGLEVSIKLESLAVEIPAGKLFAKVEWDVTEMSIGFDL